MCRLLASPNIWRHCGILKQTENLYQIRWLWSLWLKTLQLLDPFEVQVQKFNTLSHSCLLTKTSNIAFGTNSLFAILQKIRNGVTLTHRVTQKILLIKLYNFPFGTKSLIFHFPFSQTLYVSYFQRYLTFSKIQYGGYPPFCWVTGVTLFHPKFIHLSNKKKSWKSAKNYSK